MALPLHPKVRLNLKKIIPRSHDDSSLLSWIWKPWKKWTLYHQDQIYWPQIRWRNGMTKFLLTSAIIWYLKCECILFVSIICVCMYVEDCPTYSLRAYFPNISSDSVWIIHDPKVANLMSYAKKVESVIFGMANSRVPMWLYLRKVFVTGFQLQRDCF